MYRDICIEVAMNGFLVKVGCSSVVFNNKKDLKKAFCQYIDDPKATEKAFLEKDLRGKGGVGLQVEERAAPVDLPEQSKSDEETERGNLSLNVARRLNPRQG